MTKKIFYSGIALFMLATACKKDSKGPAADPTPVITAVSKTQVQTGDTVVITGTHLKRDTLTPSVIINGRTATILESSAETISIVIPPLVKSGAILLFLGNTSIQGPELTVIPTPKITGYSPRFVVRGDTLLIQGENFASAIADNQLYIGGVAATVVSASSNLLKVLVPETSEDGILSCRVYNGPLAKYDGTPVLLRYRTYEASTIQEYLSKDPGFSFVSGYFDGSTYDLTNQSAGKAISDYLTGVKKGIMFIPNNNFAYNRGFSSVQALLNNVRWYDMFYPLLAVTHDETIDLASLQLDYKYPSELTGDVILGWTPGTRDFFSISETDGQKYVSTLSYGYPIGTYKILRQIDVNGSIIFEIESLPSFESQPGTY